MIYCFEVFIMKLITSNSTNQKICIKKTVENMEHIHFKEKFTKKKCTGRQHQSSSCRMGEGGGGHKKTCTTSIPF